MNLGQGFLSSVVFIESRPLPRALEYLVNFSPWGRKKFFKFWTSSSQIANWRGKRLFPKILGSFEKQKIQSLFFFLFRRFVRLSDGLSFCLSVCLDGDGNLFLFHGPSVCWSVLQSVDLDLSFCLSALTVGQSCLPVCLFINRYIC